MGIYMWREYDWLCFTANTAGSTIKLQKYNSPTSITLETSTDWNTWSTYSMGDTITLSNIWDKVYWRNTSTTTTWFSTSGSARYEFVMTWSIAASGDVTSLINKDWTDTLVSDYCFYRLFINNTSLTTAPKVPAINITNNCYQHMFSGCENLTTACELPATTIKDFCYTQMFYNCPNLVQLPKLPATNLSWTTNCYENMFVYCSKIKISTTQTWEYQTAYRIPTSWTWTVWTNSLRNLFFYTWWTFTWTPTINTTYYTSNTVV